MASKKSTPANPKSTTVDPQNEKFPAAFVISRQLDHEKINFLTKRVEELILNNNELRVSSSQNERDTHDIVLYFQREMEMKDDIILKLNEELVKCQTQLKFEVERVQKTYEAEILELRTNSEKIISDLATRLEASEADLKTIEIFRQEKDLHEGSISKLENAMQTQRDQLIDAMEGQERRFLEEKSQMFKDLDEQKSAFREVALKEARLALGDEARKIMADNNRMFEELKFHHSEAAEYQVAKEKLENELKTARKSIVLLQDKELEYAQLGHQRAKEIKNLKDRVDGLEKLQTKNIEKYKLQNKEMKLSIMKELEAVTLDAASLRRLISMKNKELRQMKTLAATILSQRTETEQFFLESLQEVKEVIRKERKKSYQDNKILSNHLKHGIGYQPNSSSLKSNHGVTFPPLNIKGSSLQFLDSHRKPSDINVAELERVTMKDLTWDDKELILRVLFAKMNQNERKAADEPISRNTAKRIHFASNPLVFVSEGVQLPDNEAAMMYQGNFQVQGLDEEEEDDLEYFDEDDDDKDGNQKGMKEKMLDRINQLASTSFDLEVVTPGNGGYSMNHHVVDNDDDDDQIIVDKRRVRKEGTQSQSQSIGGSRSSVDRMEGLDPEVDPILNSVNSASSSIIIPIPPSKAKR